MYESLSATQCVLMKGTAGTQDSKTKTDGKSIAKGQLLLIWSTIRASTYSTNFQGGSH